MKPHFYFMLLLSSGCAGQTAGDLGPCANTPDPAEHSTLVVATSTPLFAAGTLSLVDLESHSVCDDVATSTADSVIAIGPQGQVIDVGRLGSDRLNIFSPPRFDAPEASFSVGRASNPQGAAWCGGAWWVPRLATAELAAFDAEGRQVGSVDLSSFADQDGIPEAAAAVSDGEVLDVVLQRLDRDDGFAPTDKGHIVRIDCEAATVLDSAETSPNPELAVRGSEPVVLAGRGLQAWSGTGALTPLAELSERPSSAAFTASGHGVVVTRADSGWHHVHCLDPDGTVTPLGFTDAFITDAVSVDDQHIWLTFRQGWADPESRPSGHEITRDFSGGLWRLEPQFCTREQELETALMPYSIGVF